MTVNRQFSCLKFSFISNSKPNDADTSVSENSQFKEQSENQSLGDSADEILRHLKLKNVIRLVIGHLSINSLRNNFESLKFIVKNSLRCLYDI